MKVIKKFSELMFYKEIKLFVAHRILKSINNTYNLYNGKNSVRSYTWLEFKYIKKSNLFFGNRTLRDAALMLKKNGHADILDNRNDIYKIRIGMLKDHFYECETAYREKLYIRKMLNSVKGVILALSALIIAFGIIIGLIKLILNIFHQ